MRPSSSLFSFLPHVLNDKRQAFFHSLFFIPFFFQHFFPCLSKIWCNSGLEGWVHYIILLSVNWYLTLCMLDNFSWFCCCLLTFFQTILSGTLSECQTVWIHTRTKILSILIWVQAKSNLNKNLSNTGLGSPKNQKATKLTFIVGPTSACQGKCHLNGICWWANNGPLILVFGSLIPPLIQLKKNVKFGPPLTKLSGSAHSISFF